MEWRRILSPLSGGACIVKLRLGVVGAVIGGPPVVMFFTSTPQSHFVRQLPVKGNLLAKYSLFSYNSTVFYIIINASACPVRKTEAVGRLS